MDPGEFIGMIVAFGLVVVVPIVAMTLAHQRRMAELTHGKQGPNPIADQRIAHLEAQVAELRQIVYDQAIRLDDRSDATRRLNQPPAPPTTTETLYRSL